MEGSFSSWRSLHRQRDFLVGGLSVIILWHAKAAVTQLWREIVAGLNQNALPSWMKRPHPDSTEEAEGEDLGGNVEGRADENVSLPAPVHLPVRSHSDPRIDTAMYIRYDPLPEAKSGAIVVVLPGGNYDFCDVDSGEGQVVAQFLAKAGIIAVLLKYRLVSQGHYWPAQRDDLFDCLRQVQSAAKSWGGDPDRVGVMGFSAGGHLASYGAVTAPESIRPKLQMLIYPGIDPATPRGHFDPTFHWTSSRGYPALEDSALQVLEADPNTSIPPAFLVGCERDEYCPVEENCEPFAEKLQVANVECRYIKLQEHSHGCGLQPEWQDALKEWLQAQGFLTAAQS